MGKNLFSNQDNWESFQFIIRLNSESYFKE